MKLATLACLAILHSAPATAYDMDCAVILCMAGGFPGAECQKAYAYMIERITPIPSLPPFGICTTDGPTPTDYAPSSRDFPWLANTRILWYSGRFTDRGQAFTYEVRSCTLEENCRVIQAAEISPPAMPVITTENGLTVPLGQRGEDAASFDPNHWPARAMGLEYMTHDMKPVFTGWYGY